MEDLLLFPRHCPTATLMSCSAVATLVAGGVPGFPRSRGRRLRQPPGYGMAFGLTRTQPLFFSEWGGPGKAVGIIHKDVMKITQLYVYPVKSLRGIPLQQAKLSRQGVQYDRRFMLLKAHDDGHYESVEVVRFPACALFVPELVGGHIVVSYQMPEEPLFPPTPEQKTTLTIPLAPAISGLGTVEVDLYKSKCMGYRMPDEYSSWFSGCFGFEAVLVYIGDAKRPVLGTLSPHAKRQQDSGWFSSWTRYFTGSEDPHWLTFTCMSAYLITTEASFDEVRRRLPDGERLDARKFRANIVVDGQEPYDEDFWGEITVNTDGPRFLLTGNCGRCVSVNVDYETGRRATGEAGTILAKLMQDRRVDRGNQWAPIFGRFSFLEQQEGEVHVGDEVTVSKRLEERCVWDWPPSTPAGNGG